jgi:hypothetical protein
MAGRLFELVSSVHATMYISRPKCQEIQIRVGLPPEKRGSQDDIALFVLILLLRDTRISYENEN